MARATRVRAGRKQLDDGQLAFVLAHEAGFNISVVRLLEPVMHQAEYEADEVGLLLAALAGYEPAQQLRFMEFEADAEAPRAAVVSTHPRATSRLARLQTRLPLAERIFEYGVQQRETAR